MGYELRPASWDGQDRPKISAKLTVCKCSNQPRAHVDAAGMWGVECHRCGTVFLGYDLLGCETWQELVREWNAWRAMMERPHPNKLAKIIGDAFGRGCDTVKFCLP